MTTSPTSRADATGEMLPCPFCGSKIRHVESWAKSFNPPRLYHEWHHDETICQIHPPRRGSMVADATDDPEMQKQVIDRWNTRAAAPPEGVRADTTDDFRLPCDVSLLSPEASLSKPNLIFRQGCKFSGLVGALRRWSALSPAAAGGEDKTAWEVFTYARDAVLAKGATADHADQAGLYAAIISACDQIDLSAQSARVKSLEEVLDSAVALIEAARSNHIAGSRDDERWDDDKREFMKAAALLSSSDQIQSTTETNGCLHDWQIWPETDGQEQRCMKCGIYRATPSD